MPRIILLALAVVLFALVAAGVLDTNLVRWEAGAFAVAFAAFFPWPDAV